MPAQRAPVRRIPSPPISSILHTTTVSAFYPLRVSKHGIGRFVQWLPNFMALRFPLVLFTDAASAPMFRALRSDPYFILIERPFDSWNSTTPAMMTMWRRQFHQHYSQKAYQPELFAVWAIKMEAIHHALHALGNPFNSTWFCWMDVGMIRQLRSVPLYANYPSKVPELAASGRMHFLEIQTFKNRYFKSWYRNTSRTAPRVGLGGTVMLGDAAAWDDFVPAYFKALRELDARGVFVGDDQHAYFHMLFENRTAQPFRLFFPTPDGWNGLAIDPWMSLPIIFGGGSPAVLDMRFEAPAASFAECRDRPSANRTAS